MKNAIAHKLSNAMLYKSTSFVFGFLCGSAIALLLSYGRFGLGFTVAILIALALVAAATLLGSYMADGITKKLDAMLYEELEPELFLKSFNKKIFNKNPKYWTVRELLYVGLAKAALGESQEAEKLYIDFLNTHKVSGDLNETANMLIPASMLSALYYDFGKTDALKRSNDKLRSMVGAKPLHPEIAEFYRLSSACEAVYNGDAQQSIEFFKHKVEKAENPLKKVIAHYRLALAYEQAGLQDPAASELEYVSKNGKKLYYAKIAREA